MKRCDVCNEMFNPHDEDICKKCRDESQAVTYESYMDMQKAVRKFGKMIEEFIDFEDFIPEFIEDNKKNQVERFHKLWKKKFSKLIDCYQYLL